MKGAKGKTPAKKTNVLLGGGRRGLADARSKLSTIPKSSPAGVPRWVGEKKNLKSVLVGEGSILPEHVR